MSVKHIVVAAVIALPLPAIAEDQWAVTGTFYGWLPGLGTTVETPFGEVEAEADFSDILDVLDFAFLSAVEARKGRWSLIGDLQYYDLGAAASPSIPLVNSVEIDFDLTILGAYALYAVVDQPDLRFELGGGLRYTEAMIDTVVTTGAPNRFSDEGSWVDPVLSARVTKAFNPDWSGVAYLDVGGFGVGEASDLTVQAFVGSRYELNESWSTLTGYRHLWLKRDFDGTTITI